MVSVIIYSTLTCPYCVHAKNLLKEKGVQFQEYYIDQDSDKRAEMLAKTNGARTVPQIFINGKHVGGFDDLKLMNQMGQLDLLLRD